MIHRNRRPPAGPGVTDAEITERLRRGAAAITVPDDLLAALREAAREEEAAERPRTMWSGRIRIAIAAAAVAAVVTPATLLASAAVRSDRTTHPGAAAPPPGIELTVHNAEVACRQLRTPECALGLSADPHAPYTAAAVVGHVWHGDVLRVDCVVRDGRLVTDEQGMSSTRWYHLADGGGWLPGVRTREGAFLPDCPAGR
jgi:hypothetical protein